MGITYSPMNGLDIVRAVDNKKKPENVHERLMSKRRAGQNPKAIQCTVVRRLISVRVQLYRTDRSQALGDQEGDRSQPS